MNIHGSFWFSKVSKDLLLLIKFSLYDIIKVRLQSKILKKLRKRWKSRKIDTSEIWWRRQLHPGRLFLHLQKRRDMIHLYPLYYQQKIYLWGIELKCYDKKVVRDCLWGLTKRSGCILNVQKNMGKIIDLCQKNGWDDFEKQYDWTIVRYLLDKENI